MLLAGWSVQAAAQQSVDPNPDVSRFSGGNYPTGGGASPVAGARDTSAQARPGAGKSPAIGADVPPNAVRFQARDSLIFHFRQDSAGRNQTEGALYGFSRVDHEKGALSAGRITVRLDLDQVEAMALSNDDSLSYPVLQRPGEDQELRSQRILFNYETGRGKFEAARVTVAEGTLLGSKVKNVSESVVFIEEGRYSTCPPDQMYYYIQAQKLKIIDQEEIFFTNARLFLLDIPYPIPLPFGYVPASPDRRRSGLLQPTFVFQNTSRRGLGLQNVGWFQIVNDYLTAQSSFDLFTSGSYFNQTQLQYRRTDRYDGGLTLGYSNERGLEPTDPDFTETVSKRLTLRHNQTFSPYASISANLNLNTSNYFQRNSYDISERGSTSSTSRLSYQYRDPDGRFSFSTNASLTQQFTTNSTTLTGPTVNFSARTFNPFKKEGSQTGAGTGGSAGRTSLAENFTVNYKSDLSTRFDYRPQQSADNPASWLDALLDPSVYRDMTGKDDHIRLGLRQNLGLSMGQLLPSRFLLMSANFTMTEQWVPSTIRKSVDPETGAVQTRTVRGFATAREGQASLNLNTTLYGLADIKLGKIERIRHTLRPSLALAYRPDFSKEFWGIYRTYDRGEGREPGTYSIFENSLYGTPSGGESRSLNYSISNVLEIKQVTRDSTGEVKDRNIRLIDNLSFSGGYNFAADSLRLSNLSVRLTSRAVPSVNLQLTASYRFYGTDSLGRTVDRLIWQDSGKLLQPLSYRFSASTSFKGGRRGVEVSAPVYGPYDPFEQSYFAAYDPDYLRAPTAPLQSPWSVNLSFNYSWNWRFGQEARKTAVLNAQSIRFRLSDRWDVSTRLGYDFIKKELTPSQFNLNRNMVCWNLSFQFNPFGDFTYYFFRLSVSGGQIQNLFQKLPGLNNLERSSSPTGRRFN